MAQLLAWRDTAKTGKFEAFFPFYGEKMGKSF